MLMWTLGPLSQGGGLEGAKGFRHCAVWGIAQNDMGNCLVLYIYICMYLHQAKYCFPCRWVGIRGGLGIWSTCWGQAYGGSTVDSKKLEYGII